MIEIYKDEICHVTIDDQPITLGHVRVTLNNVQPLWEISTQHMNHIFALANKISSILFDGLNAHGTNIISHANEGVLQIIARFQEDNLGLEWEPQQGDQAAVASMAKSIQGAIIPADPPPPKPEVVAEQRESEHIDPYSWDEPKDSKLDFFRKHP